MTEHCKEISHEYSIVKSPDSTVISLYRFPNLTRNFKPIEINQKPTSKYTEIKASLPSKNTSALKTKTLNTASITYKALPNATKSYYYTKIEGNKIILYKVHNSYLFQPSHDSHPFEYQSSKTKKAESREEFEHRMRNINFKLKNLEEEETRSMRFIDCSDCKAEGQENRNGEQNSPVNKTDEKNKVANGTDDINMNKEVPVSDSMKINDLHKNSDKSEIIKRIERTIHNARICNYSDLIKMFPDQKLLKSILFRMTLTVAGRCVLKNSFYEKTLHGIREQLFSLFEESPAVDMNQLGFLGNEKWLIHELADQEGTVFKMKGFREAFELNLKEVRENNRRLINEAFSKSRMLSLSQISSETSLDEQLISEIIHNNDDFIHLSNNCYALNDESYWLNDIFILLKNRKSFDLAGLEEELNSNQINYNNTDLLCEIKKYCVLRNNKYFIKIPK